MNTPLNVTLVGAGRMSRSHVRALAALPELFRLTAVVDPFETPRLAATAEFAVPGFPTLDEAVATRRPDLIVIVTPNDQHAPLTLRAAELGLRAVFCEKPMSVDLSAAHAMVHACESASTRLFINHQRRVGDVGDIRAALDQGLLGPLLSLEGACAGELLSDGTHTIDSLLALASDPAVPDVRAALDLGKITLRYGAPAEAGALLFWQIPHGGPTFTVRTGTYATARGYQNYLLTGEGGQLLRVNDALGWFLNDGHPGTHRLRFDREKWFAHPQPDPTGGPWRPFKPVPDAPPNLQRAYACIHKTMTTGRPNPLDGRRNLQVHSLLTAAYLAGLHRQPVALDDTLLTLAPNFPLTEVTPA